MRRIIGAIGSSRPYSKDNSRRKGISTVMAARLQEFRSCRCVFAQIGSKSPGAGGVSAMKFKVDIDCTPDEARAFLGLPDVRPLHEALLPEVEERLRATLKAMDPETMLKTWLPATLKGFEQLQEMFLSQLGGLGKKK
jgi:hypothetical protein